MNRSWQLAKANLGLGNAVGGTGFCVAIDVLRKVGWKARSLTEDLEFQIQCLLEGIPARWNHYARVYDEKPTDFIASVIQRLRWARGHWDVCIHYSWPLLKRAILKRDLLAFDGLVYLLNPGKIVISTITAILLGLGLIEEVKWFKAIIPPWAWAAVLAFQFFYLAYCMVMDAKRKIASVIKGMVCLPIFNYTYVPLFFWALFTHKNKTWKRTEHVRGISIKDLEK